MAIKNIDDSNYVELYQEIDSNKLIAWYQKNYKYKYSLPVLKLSDKNKPFLDIGCARGDFLYFLHRAGFTDLHGIDVDDALTPGLRDFITFNKLAIDDESLEMQCFDSVQIASVLHHLPVKNLTQTAKNLAKLVSSGGYLYIYEVNRKTFLGKLYNSCFLRIFPQIYKANEYERAEQEAFSAVWKDFIKMLEADFIPVKRNNHGICVSFVGRKK